MKTTKSPYEIKWVIIDNYSAHLWKYQEQKLKKLGFVVIHGMGLQSKQGIAVKHYAGDDYVKADKDVIKSAFQILKSKGIGAIITDKQFGMIDTTKDIRQAILISTTKQRDDFEKLIK